MRRSSSRNVRGAGSGTRMGAWLLLVAAQLVFTGVVTLADGGDDFNDNSRDPARWGRDNRIGRGALTERNGWLEFTVDTPTPEDYALRPWELTRMPCKADWEVQIDLHNVTVPEEPYQANSFGIYVLSPHSAGSYMELEMYASNLEGGGARRGFWSSLNTDDEVIAEPDSGGDATLTSGAVRMSFEASTKTIRIFFDKDLTDGYQWVEFGSYGLAGASGLDGNTDWGLGNADQFTIYLYGFSQGMIIRGEQVYGDNFQETGGTDPTGGPAPNPVGNYRFTFPTDNPLLTAIFALTGHYQWVAPPLGPDPPLSTGRNRTADVAQDESGKLAIMATSDGVVDDDGNTDLTQFTGAVKTQNDEPTVSVKSKLSGTMDGVKMKWGLKAGGPPETVDVDGQPGIGANFSYKADVGGLKFADKNVWHAAPHPPETFDNIQSGWSIEIDIQQAGVKGKAGTVATGRLTLPGGDIVVFPAKAVKYKGAAKGYSLSFKKGTNITVNPPRIEKKASIKIKGLTFEQEGTEWIPTGGAIDYRFLGQKGRANLMDFMQQ